MKKNIVILAISLLVLLTSLFAISKLEIISNMEDMLPEDSDSLKASEEFNKYFDGQDQAIVVVKYTDDTTIDDSAKRFLDDLYIELKDTDYIESILYRVDTSEMMPYAWAYVEMDIYDDVKTAMDDNDLGAIQEILSQLDSDMDDANAHSSEYLANDDGTHYMMILKPALDNSDFMNSRSKFYNGVNDNIAELLERTAYKNINAGLTGGAFIQDIEADTVAFDGLFGTMVITLILILLVLIVFFRGLKLPLLAVYPLLLGAIMAAASAYVIYGSLNMFAVSFALLLLGLGIDFGVHLLTRYQEERNNGIDLNEATKIATKSTGMSIVFGAVTTAIAFASFAFAKFKAFEQMGVISAIGLILLCVCMLVIIPAIIKVFDRKKTNQAKQLNMNWLGKVVESNGKRPYIVGIALLVIIGGLLTFVLDTTIQTDITAIYPDNITSLIWAEEVEQAFDYNTDTITIYADDSDQLAIAIDNLAIRDDIEYIDSILDYMPEQMDEKLSIISDLDMILQSVGVDAFADMTLEPMSIDDLPQDIKDNYIGKDGKVRAEIIPAVNIYDREIYDNLMDGIYDEMGRYPTGMPTIFNEITTLVNQDIINISAFCFLVVFIISWIVFKRLKLALLTITPLFLTLYATLGLLPLLNIEINVFSIAAFPLIIGIAIDSSIHLIHRLDEESDLDISQKVMNTGRAIILTGITTILGFGSLAMINHPGMANLGLSVAVGMAISTIFTLAVVPLGYMLLTKKRI